MTANGIPVAGEDDVGVRERRVRRFDVLLAREPPHRAFLRLGSHSRHLVDRRERRDGRDGGRGGGDRIRDARRDGGGVRRGDERLRPTSLFVFEFRLGEFRLFVFRGGGFLPREFLRLGGGGDARVIRATALGASRLSTRGGAHRRPRREVRGEERRGARADSPPSTARNSEAFSAAAAAHPARVAAASERSSGTAGTGTAGTGTAGTGTARAAFARTAFA